MPDAPDPADSRLALVRSLERLFDASRRGDQRIPQAAVALSGAVVNHTDDEQDATFICFHDAAVYVDTELLRAPTPLYEKLVEIEQTLGRVGRNEIVLARSLSDGDAEALARWFREAEDHPDDAEPTGPPTSRVAIRSVDPAVYLGVVDPRSPDRPTEERVAAFYAGARSVLEEFDRMAVPDDRKLDEFRRVGRGLISLTGRARATILALATRNEMSDDRYSLALDTAILALLMARRLTGSIPTLENICAAAISAGLDASGPDRPSDSAASLLRGSRIDHHTLQRAIAAFEARTATDTGLEKEDALEALSSVDSRLVGTAFRYLALSRHGDTTPDDVIDHLRDRADTDVEQAVLRLLLDTLGLFTSGMPVELSSGWRGVVVEAGKHTTDFQRPEIRMGRKPDGERIPPFDVDLGTPDSLESYGHVVRRFRIEDDPHLEQIRRSVEDTTAAASPPGP